MSAPRPPRLAEWILSGILRVPDREHILGDLAEEYAARRAEGASGFATSAWYWSEVARSVRPVLGRSLALRRGRSYDPRRSTRPVRAAALAPSDLGSDAVRIVRSLLRRPVYPLLAVLTLGLGMGAAAATFAVAHGVLLEPLPLPDADRLVSLRHLRLTAPDDGGGALSAGTFVRYRDGSRLLESLAAFTIERVSVTDGTPETIRIAYPTPSLGAVVGLPTVLGRWNSEEDMSAERWVTVLSHALWMRRYGGAPGVVGDVIHLDGFPVEIIGVAPPEAAALWPDIQLWVPVRGAMEDRGFGGFGWRGVGRLRPGATVEALEAEMGDLLATLPEVLPQHEAAWRRWYEDFQIRPWPRYLLEERVGSSARWIWLLLGASLLVFLVGLVNVGILALARSADRDVDVAVRAALGGGRGSLVGHFALEAGILAGVSAVAALGLALVLVRAVPALGDGVVPRIQEIGIDLDVVLATTALSLVAAIALAAIPALRIPRDLGSTLRSAQSGGSPLLRRSQSGLVVAQVALAAALVIFGGLMGRSFWTLRTMDLGFPREDLYTFTLTFPTHADSEAGKHAFFRQLQERLEAIPGVTSASASECVPLRCVRPQGVVREIEGRVLGTDDVEPLIRTSRIMPGYFATLGVPLERGHDVTWADAYTPDDGEVFGVTPEEGWVFRVVINQRAAEGIFPGREAVGRHFRAGSNPPTVVAGVVPDVVLEGLSLGRSGSGMVRYLPDPRFDGMEWLIRSTLPLESLQVAIQEAVWEMEPAAPVEGLTHYDDLVAEATRDRTLIFLLAAAGAGFAMILGLVGMYGALAHEVRRRRRDFGIRNALGADARRLSQGVLRRAVVLIAVGLGGGFAVAAVSSRVLESVVFGVSPTDPVTYLAAGLVLSVLGLTAAYVPARRASRADPLEALRAE